MNNVFGEEIFRYTVADGERDGIFIKIDMAKELGIIKTFFTSNLINRITPTEEQEARGQSLDGRIWDVLNMFRFTVKSISQEEKDSSFISFEVLVPPEKIKVYACIQDYGDNTPCITIMLPEDY